MVDNFVLIVDDISFGDFANDCGIDCDLYLSTQGAVTLD
jgi:hypothetical protein